MRKCLNYVLANACDFLINQPKIKYQNDDSSDSLDLMINHNNPLITKIMVQTTISENFKGLAL